MSRQIINKIFTVLLLVIGLAGIHATSSSTESPSEYARGARDHLYEAITADYLKVLDFELKDSRQLVERVLEDERFQNVDNEILLNKKITLRNFVELAKTKSEKKPPSKEFKPPLFFYIFGKSLLYKDFLDIVARLEPTESRYDCWIESDLMSFGLEAYFETLNKKRIKLVRESVRRIDDYVNGLPADQQRKAAAQKLSDWSGKLKEATEVQQKVDALRDFLRDYYLETAS